MKAHEAAAALADALCNGINGSSGATQTLIDAFHDGLQRVNTTFRTELELTYAFHLSADEQSDIWDLACATADPGTWENTEETYRMLASQRTS